MTRQRSYRKSHTYNHAGVIPYPGYFQSPPRIDCCVCISADRDSEPPFPEPRAAPRRTWSTVLLVKELSGRNSRAGRFPKPLQGCGRGGAKLVVATSTQSCGMRTKSRDEGRSVSCCTWPEHFSAAWVVTVRTTLQRLRATYDGDRAVPNRNLIRIFSDR